MYFYLVFDDETKFAKILESIKVDDDLHVQLQYNGMPLPLPQWFVQGHNAGNTKKSNLENFPAYIQNKATNNYNEHLNELNQRNFYKLHGRPQYSVSMIWYALHLHYFPRNTYFNEHV